MNFAALLIWLIAFVLGLIAYSRPGKLHLQGLKIARKYAVSLFPMLIMAVLVSGFFSVIIPTDLVATWLGRDSGLKGILVASLVGGLTPGGPIISFPIVVILLKTGAAVPPLIAFLTAWSVFAIHRMIAYEIPLMGFRFTMVRILSSLFLPPLAGMLAAGIEANLHIGI